MGSFPSLLLSYFWQWRGPRGKTLLYTNVVRLIHSCDLTECLPQINPDQSQSEETALTTPPTSSYLDLRWDPEHNCAEKNVDTEALI